MTPMKKLILLSVMSAAIFSMSTASAGGGSLFSDSSNSEASLSEGFYAGGSYGVATTNCMIHDYLSLEEDCDMDGWKAFAGYRINDIFSIEGGYYHMGKTEESLIDNIFDQKTGVTI